MLPSAAVVSAGTLKKYESSISSTADDYKVGNSKNTKSHIVVVTVYCTKY